MICSTYVQTEIGLNFSDDDQVGAYTVRKAPRLHADGDFGERYQMAIKALAAKALKRDAETTLPKFASTDDLKKIAAVFGQDRAVDAIEFGAAIDHPGYNLFVAGTRGAGRHSIVRRLLQPHADDREPQADWVYLNNFDDPQRPLALRLPAGSGMKLRNEMAVLVDELGVTLPGLFESDEYRNRLNAIQAGFEQRHEEVFNALRDRARQDNIALLQGPRGFMFAPLKGSEVITPEEFQKLSQEEQAALEQLIAKYQAELKTVLEEMPKWHKEIRDAVKELNQEVARSAVVLAMAPIRLAFKDFDECVRHFDRVERDLLNEIELFVPVPPTGPVPQNMPGMPDPETSRAAVLRRYTVNVLVDNGSSKGAPVIFENNPSLFRISGRAEHVARFGTLVTDFTHIKPGALHMANGGFLVIDTAKLLTQPFAWEALKRAIQSREIRIESPGEMLGQSATVTLEPEPIPLDIKIVLIGEHEHFYLLNRHDPDFSGLFKILADLNEQIEWTRPNAAKFAGLIATIAEHEGLMPFLRSGVAALTEFSARLADDTEKLSLVISRICDVMREADHLAKAASEKKVSRQTVEAAIRAQRYRASRVEEMSRESITREIVMVDTSGEAVGQINGLSVLDLGNMRFGRPTRITARIGLGTGRVLDIEREADLGGPLHTKGVMILSGYLSAMFGADRPLPLSATLAFEQSYSGVDGDSASSTELYALLSAISGIPIRQSLAVTGSVNQNGEVQAIGGVNEKIEGFFDICAHRGLTGDQGVLIPKANTKHLMLRNEVLEAARDGKFHIYPVSTIEEGIELLTGIRAGKRNSSGAFPKNTVFALVEHRLTEMIEARRKFGSGGGRETPSENGER